MLLRSAWYIGAWADELGDKPLARRICSDPVVLFRDGSGKAAALADRCCHRAAPLHLGNLVEASRRSRSPPGGWSGTASCERTEQRNEFAAVDVEADPVQYR